MVFICDYISYCIISGIPRPLVRHNRSKIKDGPPVTERFKTQPVAWNDNNEQDTHNENYSLNQSKSSANVLDRDEDGKLFVIYK